MPERPPLSVAALEMLAREETRARHARYLDEPRDDRYATYRLGVDTVRCVLGCGGTTINPTGECNRCVAEWNEVELRRGGWPSWTGEPREGWD